MGSKSISPPRSLSPEERHTSKVVTHSRSRSPEERHTSKVVTHSRSCSPVERHTSKVVSHSRSRSPEERRESRSKDQKRSRSPQERRTSTRDTPSRSHSPEKERHVSKTDEQSRSSRRETHSRSRSPKERHLSKSHEPSRSRSPQERRTSKHLSDSRSHSPEEKRIRSHSPRERRTQDDSIKRSKSSYYNGVEKFSSRKSSYKDENEYSYKDKKSSCREYDNLSDDEDDIGQKDDLEKSVPTIGESLAELERDKNYNPDDDYESGSSEDYTDIPDLSNKGKKWTPKKEALLCTLWEDERHLYDCNDANYRKRENRAIALRNFGQLLHMSGRKYVKNVALFV